MVRLAQPDPPPPIPEPFIEWGREQGAELLRKCHEERPGDLAHLVERFALRAALTAWSVSVDVIDAETSKLYVMQYVEGLTAELHEAVAMIEAIKSVRH